jgi:hypothetical protein
MVAASSDPIDIKPALAGHQNLFTQISKDIYLANIVTLYMFLMVVTLKVLFP